MIAHPRTIKTVFPLGLLDGRLSFIDGGRTIFTGLSGAFVSAIANSHDPNLIFAAELI
jgi:hypothetical protein